MKVGDTAAEEAVHWLDGLQLMPGILLLCSWVANPGVCCHPLEAAAPGEVGSPSDSAVGFPGDPASGDLGADTGSDSHSVEGKGLSQESDTRPVLALLSDLEGWAVSARSVHVRSIGRP